MKRSHVSPTLLVLVYVVFVIGGVTRFVTEGFGVLRAAALVLDIVVLMALLVVAGSWARELGVIAGWLKVALGGIVMALGAYQVLTLNLIGLFYVALGAVIVAFGFWTVSVLWSIDREARAIAT